ncbi:MAG: hypothetical protein ACP5SH_16695 [Syntrophobacteraceae bacterium]
MDVNEISRLKPDAFTLSSGETVFVHLFRPQDAPGIGQLFHSVYGDKYPVKHFYDPEGLLRVLESGDNYSIVARKENGSIIGHMGLFRSAPFPGLYEAGAGMVLSELRKEGLNQALLHYTYETLSPALGIDEAWGEAVCNHVYMQKTVERFKFIETGLEIDLMPEEAYAREKSSAGRVSSLVAFRCYIPKPHAVYLPTIYEKVLRTIYSRLDDTRTLKASEAKPPAGSASDVSFEIFEFAQVVRVRVTTIGEDFEACFKKLETKLLAGNIKVLQVWVNLACPWVGRAVEILRRKGYFFGALLPRWFGEDGLMMQKIIDPPGWENITLFSDRARELLEIIRNDREDVLRLETRR